MASRVGPGSRLVQQRHHVTAPILSDPKAVRGGQTALYGTTVERISPKGSLGLSIAIGAGLLRYYDSLSPKERTALENKISRMCISNILSKKGRDRSKDVGKLGENILSYFRADNTVREQPLEENDKNILKWASRKFKISIDFFRSDGSPVSIFSEDPLPSIVLFVSKNHTYYNRVIDSETVKANKDQIWENRLTNLKEVLESSSSQEVWAYRRELLTTGVPKKCHSIVVKESIKRLKSDIQNLFKIESSDHQEALAKELDKLLSSKVNDEVKNEAWNLLRISAQAARSYIDTKPSKTIEDLNHIYTHYPVFSLLEGDKNDDIRSHISSKIDSIEKELIGKPFNEQTLNEMRDLILKTPIRRHSLINRIYRAAKAVREASPNAKALFRELEVFLYSKANCLPETKERLISILNKITTLPSISPKKFDDEVPFLMEAYRILDETREEIDSIPATRRPTLQQFLDEGFGLLRGALPKFGCAIIEKIEKIPAREGKTLRDLKNTDQLGQSLKVIINVCGRGQLPEEKQEAEHLQSLMRADTNWDDWTARFYSLISKLERSNNLALSELSKSYRERHFGSQAAPPIQPASPERTEPFKKFGVKNGSVKKVAPVFSQARQDALDGKSFKNMKAFRLWVEDLLKGPLPTENELNKLNATARASAKRITPELQKLIEQVNARTNKAVPALSQARQDILDGKSFKNMKAFRLWVEDLLEGPFPTEVELTKLNATARVSAKRITPTVKELIGQVNARCTPLTETEEQELSRLIEGGTVRSISMRAWKEGFQKFFGKTNVPSDTKGVLFDIDLTLDGHIMPNEHSLSSYKTQLRSNRSTQLERFDEIVLQYPHGKIRETTGNGDCAPYSFIGGLIEISRQNPEKLNRLAVLVPMVKLLQSAQNKDDLLYDDNFIQTLSNQMRILLVNNIQRVLSEIHPISFEEAANYLPEEEIGRPNVWLSAQHLEMFAYLAGLNVHVYDLVDPEQVGAHTYNRRDENGQPDMVLIRSNGNHFDQVIMNN